MFVAIAKISLSIPDSGSLKSKRHVLRKVLDKVKSRFNVSIAEVADNDLWQRATIGVAAVSNDHSFAQESIDKVIRFIDEMYVAPIISRQTEIIPMGGDLFGQDSMTDVQHGVRSLAEAEAEFARSAHRTLAEAEGDGDDASPPAHAPHVQHAPPHAERPRKRSADRHEPRESRDRHSTRHNVPMTEDERERALDELKRRMKTSKDKDDEQG